MPECTCGGFDHGFKMATRNTTERNWYLVYCKPRQEGVARVNLNRQGYETYLPFIHEIRRRKGRRVSLIAPMFPRYLFVHLHSRTDNWAPIRSTSGVVSLVRFGPSAARVPDDLIVLLKSRENSEGVHILPAEEYKPGRRVRITQGGFAGYEGIFQALSGHDRVTVLLDVLGRKARTIVDAASIEPA